MPTSFVVGTKGQLIKTAPVIREFQARKAPHRLILVGQHGSRLKELCDAFELTDPVVLQSRDRDVASVSDAIGWALKLAGKIVRSRPDVGFREGIVCVHGDAPPALLGMIYAFRRRARLAHLEAGERTYRLRAPFPEEAIRRVVDKFSHIHFASSIDSATVENLRREGHEGTTVDIGCNTLLDAVRFALKQPAEGVESQDYALFSVHRLETLQNRDRLARIVAFAQRSARNRDVVFPLHESTKAALERFGLLAGLQQDSRIRCRPLFPYFQFMHVIRQATYLVTDGGGPQQESFYLGRPCFIARDFTERPGYANCVLGGFSQEKFDTFMASHSSFASRNSLVDSDVAPAAKCVDRLVQQEV